MNASSARSTVDLSPIALLIDADNISANHYGDILRRAEALGDVPIRRAYLDTQHLTGWVDMPGLRLMLTPTGKNSADLLLTVEAMELALHGKVERFVLASSDGDFSHLALRLREYGLEVTGIGEAKTPQKFREACTAFHELQRPKSGAAEVEQRTEPEVAPLPHIDRKIPKDSEVVRIITESIGQNNGKLLLNRVNPIVYHALGVNIGDLPDTKWRIFFERHKALFVLRGSGMEICVCLAS